MFSFRLQSVLNYRAALEEKRLGEYAEAKKRFDEARKVLLSLNEQQARLLAEIKMLQSKPFSAVDLAMHLSLFEQCKAKKERQELVVSQLLKELQKCRALLLEARKERKIMDNLKERKRKEYDAELMSQERKAIDETAVNRYVRKEK